MKLTIHLERPAHQRELALQKVQETILGLVPLKDVFLSVVETLRDGQAQRHSRYLRSAADLHEERLYDRDKHNHEDPPEEGEEGLPEVGGELPFNGWIFGSWTSKDGYWVRSVVPEHGDPLVQVQVLACEVPDLRRMIDLMLSNLGATLEPSDPQAG